MQARLPWLYLLLVASINIFIVWESFVTESTGHLHSMHGYWMAIADRYRAVRWSNGAVTHAAPA